MNAHDSRFLIQRHLDGIATSDELARLSQQLESDADARLLFLRMARIHATLAADDLDMLSGDAGDACAADWPAAAFGGETIVGGDRQLSRWPALWGAVAVVVIALIASVYLLWSSGEPRIARITGVSGPLQWTGDGGQVFHDLNVGSELPGGTIEGMAPDSWFELEFNDGSTVTISGNSTLTFSDHGQKKLYFKEGNVSGNVQPQRRGRPMLIYTRSAMLEIIGTRFEVEAGMSATMLNVSEGRVRVTRLNDGSSVDVPAHHRVIAAADCKMTPVPDPDSVSRWRSRLQLGPENSHGKWMAATGTQPARLRAIPYTTFLGKTIYTAALGVSRGDQPPVVLQSDSRFRVRGQIESAHRVYFGVTVRRPNGEFAGNFQTIRPASDFQSGQEFEVFVELRDFQLDPSLVEMQNNLPSVPFNLVVESFWCHTLYEQAGLAVTEVELAPLGKGDRE